MKPIILSPDGEQMKIDLTSSLLRSKKFPAKKTKLILDRLPPFFHGGLGENGTDLIESTSVGL